MKKFSLLMAAALIAVSSVFVGCDKEEVTPATISFVNVTGDEVTLDEGVTTYTMVANITSTENLKSVKVTMKEGSVTQQVGETITKFAEKTSYSFQLPISNITKDLEITVTVDNGVETARTLTIKPFVAPALAPISTFPNVKIYCTGGDGSNASSAASSDGTVFPLTGASTANQQKCDFVYFYLTSGTMYSPANIASATSTLTNIVNAWTTKNDTKFTVLSSGTDFAGITAANIATIAGNPTAATAAVSNGSVVAFKTAGNKLGVFKVTALDAGYLPTNYCTIDIKVQQ
jgi:hypothetical protein